MLDRLLGYVKRHHVALLALFVVLGGSAYAARQGKVGSKRIKTDAVKERHIAPDSVDGAALKSNALAAKHGIIRTGRLSLDDPDSGSTTTATRTLLKLGPFTLAGNCNNNGGLVSIWTTLDVTERTWVTAIGGSGRLEPADVPRILIDGNTGFAAGEGIEQAGANAVALSGRLLNVGVQQLRNGLGQTDCVFTIVGFAR